MSTVCDQFGKTGDGYSPDSVPGSKRADVRQHTLDGLDLQRARPGPRRADEKKRKNKKKEKKEYAENVHSRDPRRAWRSGAKALQGYKACCLTF